MIIFVLIDTNIWIRVLSQGKPGCELDHVVALLEMVGRNEVVLILPEIVELELEKQWRELKDNLTRDIGLLEKKIEEAIKNTKLWTEIEDIPRDISAFLKEKKRKKVEAAEVNHQQVQEMFGHVRVVKIPLTQQMLFLGRKRLIAGRMPKTENSAHSDACIIEALIEYFRLHGVADSQLCFCSENVSDFGLSTSDGIILHPLLKDGLPPTKYVTTLHDLVTFCRSNTPVREPAPAEIEDALERRLLEANPDLSAADCLADGCSKQAWVVSPFCKGHFDEHFSAMTQQERADFHRVPPQSKLDIASVRV